MLISRTIVVGLLTVIAPVTTAVPATAASADRAESEPRAVSVKVNLKASGLGTISATRLGANHIYGRTYSTEYTDTEPNVFVSPTERGFDAMVSQSGIGAVRFPGGTVSNLYRHGERVQVGAEGLGPVPGVFDLARWKQLVTSGRVSPGSVAVNFASQTAAAAEEFAEAVLSSNAPGGRVRPSHFEVGNEFGYDNQQYWMRWLPEGADDADRARAYVNGRAVDITIAAGRPADHRRGSELPDPPGVSDPQRTFSVKYGPIAPGTLEVRQDGVPVSPDRYSVDLAEGTFTFNSAPSRDDGALEVSFTRPAIGFLDIERAIRDGARRAGVDPREVSVCPGFNTFSGPRQQALVTALVAAGEVPDCIAHHVYHTLNVDGSELQRGTGFWARVHDRVIGDNDRTLLRTQQFMRRIRQSFPARVPDLVLSEFGMNAFSVDGQRSEGYRYLGGLGGAVTVTRLWQRLLATTQPSVASRHALVTPAIDGAGMLLPGSAAGSRATGRVYELLGRMRGGAVRGTAITSNPRRSTRAGATYALLSVLASERGRRLQVLLVNASPFGKLDVRLDVPNSTYLRRPGRLRTLTDAVRDVDDPSAALARGGDGRGLRQVGEGRRVARPDRPLRLPPRSVSLLTLTRGRD